MIRAALGALACALAALAAGCTGGSSDASEGTPSITTTVPLETSPAETTTTSPTPSRTTESLPDVVQRVRSGIVRIEVDACDGRSTGSGFLVAPRLVATVEHVVHGAARIRLKRNGKDIGTGRVIGTDPDRDLALVRLDRKQKGHLFRFVKRQPRLGEEVVALGFPLGLPLTVTRGTVSGLNRTIPIEGLRRRALVQTDAAVNHGSSGGPLLQASTGEVIGLVDLGTTEANGLAFAVSSAVASALLEAWQRAPQPHPLEQCSDPLPPIAVSDGSTGSGKIKPGAPSVGVPSVYEGHFTSVDRLQRCYAQGEEVSCTSGPSGQRLKLVAGVNVYDQGRPGSRDVGGPSMPMGTAFTTPSGSIRCESSTRGITCLDSRAVGFTIGDRSHRIHRGGSSSGGASGGRGVPSTYEGAFTSVDRLQRCYATIDSVACSSGPSGKAVTLTAGGTPYYEGVIGSVDNGGPSMPMGTSFTVPGGLISCDSSSRGISCVERFGGNSFTIGDHTVVTRDGSGTRRY